MTGQNQTAVAGSTDEIRQYLIVTGNYWGFTLTDGALRMLVVLHFYQLGYTPLTIAMLFLFYEFFGVVTNLVGGWLGARIGLNRTMNIGLGLQILALLMLTVPPAWLGVAYVMAAQALSGIAKDLNKMSAKSSIKLLMVASRSSGSQQSRLYKWVALLTGSKNALKGVGFFLGGVLLAWLGFREAMLVMALGLGLLLFGSLRMLRRDLGRSKQLPKFREIFSKSRAVNVLSAARLFLFGARDVWFVVALPVYLSTQFDWPHTQVGGFLALWIIGYGVVQAYAPALTARGGQRVPDGHSAFAWALMLALIPGLIAFGLSLASIAEPTREVLLVVGLMVFGVLFAINSSLHSYLIVSYAREDGVSLDVGFYYMANAMGRLLGTLLSGWVFQRWGLESCLLISCVMLIVAALASLGLPKHKTVNAA